MPPGTGARSASGFKLDRLNALSDGVIAIAITLLVLGLEVPSVHDVTESELGEYLLNSIHPAIGFVVSFLVIGTFWLQHYAIFHFLIRANRVLVALNGLFLLCLSFLPFPTGLQAVYEDDEMAMVLYCVVIFLCGVSLLALWRYASGQKHLVDPDLPPAIVRSMTTRLLLTPVVCLLAIALSFVSIIASRLILLSIPVFYLSHRAVDEGLRDEL